MNSGVKTVIFWIAIVASAFALWRTTQSRGPNPAVAEISYSDFLTRVVGGQVSEVAIAGSVVNGVDSKGSNFRVVVSTNQAAMLDALQQHGVNIWFKETTESNRANWISNLAPLVLLGTLWFLMIRRIKSRPSDSVAPVGYIPPQESKPRFGP